MDMKSLIPWNRNRDVAPTLYEEQSPFLSLHHQMNRLFDDFFRDFDAPATGRNAWQMSWPRVEVSEGDKEVKLVAELAGLDDKDVDLTLRDGILTLKGEKKSETSGTSRYSERWYGRFERSFNLGPDVDPDSVRAVFQKGVLTITVGKRPEAQTSVRRIAVTRE